MASLPSLYSSAIGPRPQAARELREVPPPSRARSPGAATIRVARTAADTLEFKALYDAHFQLVWRTLWRLGVRDSDRMDLTQKVFLTAYLKMPEFEGRSSVSTWLWGICRRVALAYRRSRAIRSEIATDPISLQEWIEHRGGAASDVDTNREVVVALLSKLSEQQRIVITLF